MKYIIVVLLSAAFALLTAQTAPALTNSSVRNDSVVKPTNVTPTKKVQAQPEKATVTRPDSAKSKKKLDTPRNKPKPTPANNREQLLKAAGVSSQDWAAADFIISHESSWRPTVLNQEGCIGLGQRCPASVLLTDCPDLSEVCQIKHFSRYAVARYGSWWGAYSFWQKNSWW